MAKKARRTKKVKKPASRAMESKKAAYKPAEEPVEALEPGYDPATMGPNWRGNTRHKPRGKNWRRHAQR